MSDTEMRDVASEDTSDDSSNSNSSDSDGERVETLVAGRQKRATAANRYDRERLIQEAEEDVGNDQDEVTLLFADDENVEDEEFEGSEEDDADAELDSSSDDDDRGPNVQGDELDGEKQLQQEAKAERTKKRKARMELTTKAGLRKKVRIDPRLPTTGGPSAPKPTKKKERSFLLIDAEGRSRASMRTSTVANKEETQARLIQEEKLRVKLRAKKAKKERERAREEPPEMTQPDRLAEAERMERRNAKSLSRWETTERKRNEEQAAKLAALKNRKLNGPVITWWSGVAKWVGPKLNQVGSKDPTQEASTDAKKRGRKSKTSPEQLAPASQPDAETSLPGAIQDSANSPTEPALTAAAEEMPVPQNDVFAPPSITFTPPQGPYNFLLGIHEYASLPPEQAPSPVAGPEAPSVGPDPPPATPATPTPFPTDQGATLLSDQPQADQETPLPSQPSEPPKIEVATRNLVVLKDFDELAVRNRGDYGVFYNTRKTVRPFRRGSELCPITGLPARYRDPSTGVAYANSYAYRKLQELRNHEHTWSSMLGCYVGRAGIVARGVPEGFLGTS